MSAGMDMAGGRSSTHPGRRLRQAWERGVVMVPGAFNALVARGVITREQAQAMVADAQAKAEAAAKARAQQETTEQQQSIRVPYVPQIVKDEISKQVESEIKPQVVQDVVQQAKTDDLPRWVQHELVLRQQLYSLANRATIWMTIFVFISLPILFVWHPAGSL